MTWVLEHAPDVPPHLVAPLIGIANHADRQGRNAYVSHKTLGDYTRKAERNVRRDVAEMLTLGLIRLGDQMVVQHIRADRRPVVYDLAMERIKDDGAANGGAYASGGEDSTDESTGGRTHPAEETEREDADVRGDARVRADKDDRASASREDAHVRHGGAHTSYKPKEEPKDQEPDSLRSSGRTKPRSTPSARSGNAGTRIPDDFAVTAEMIEWAREHTPLVGRAETDAFVDYWKSTPGAKGKKLDWPATWRNWMRRAQETAEQHQRRQKPAPNGYRSQTDANIAAFLGATGTEGATVLQLQRGTS